MKILRNTIIYSFLFLLCIICCTGCEHAKDPSKEPTSREAIPYSAGETQMYSVPPENRKALSSSAIVPSSETDDFYIIEGSTYKIYDPVTQSSLFPCYQVGCTHEDINCPFYWGEIKNLAEYHGKLYGTVLSSDGGTTQVICRERIGGEASVLCSWSSQFPQKEISASLRCLSHGAAFVQVSTVCYDIDSKTGIFAPTGERNELWRIDLDTGEARVAVENMDGLSLYGVWEDRILLQSSMLKENAPSFEEFLAEDVKRATWTLYNELYVDYTLVERDIRADVETVIASKITSTVDPNTTWGQYAVYQTDNQLFVYDMQNRSSISIFDHENICNYWIMDGRVFALVLEEKLCHVFMAEISTGITLELENCGMESMCFSIWCESNTMFCGNYQGVDKYINKLDFYAGDYDNSH